MQPFGCEKVRTLEEFLPILDDLRGHGARIVFTNGCFDLVHPGHVLLLRRARELGDALVVGANSDASIRRLKGPGRPVYAQEPRGILLSALSCVDHVIFFDEDTPMRLLEAIRPEILAKGAQYEMDEIVGRDF
ncbi:MAG: adenylyltransferase/cytidyltransferase family protein, partial [Planctomycetes bacterium]|nr:adenylyltransferase/cytidyltransferase family protein [Planctomycetota bacterium]